MAATIKFYSHEIFNLTKEKKTVKHIIETHGISGIISDNSEKSSQLIIIPAALAIAIRCIV